MLDIDFAIKQVVPVSYYFVTVPAMCYFCYFYIISTIFFLHFFFIKQISSFTVLLYTFIYLYKANHKNARLPSQLIGFPENYPRPELSPIWQVKYGSELRCSGRVSRFNFTSRYSNILISHCSTSHLFFSGSFHKNNSSESLPG